MLTDILREGFAAANKRPGLIFLDILWKAVWIVLTAIVVLVAVIWFTSDLQAIQWTDMGDRRINALIAARILQELWLAKRADAILAVIGSVFISAGIWISLEALVRSKLVRDVSVNPINGPHSYSFSVFFASGLLKGAILLTTALLMLGLMNMGAATIALVTFVLFAFSVSLLDTLIRADAVELLGTDLIRVTGLLGILMSFEGMVTAAFIIILFAGALQVSGGAGALILLAAAIATLVFLNVLHGYLLLVRFSAIAIMRRNVVEI